MNQPWSYWKKTVKTGPIQNILYFKNCSQSLYTVRRPGPYFFSFAILNFLKEILTCCTDVVFLSLKAYQNCPKGQIVHFLQGRSDLTFGLSHLAHWTHICLTRIARDPDNDLLGTVNKQFVGKLTVSIISEADDIPRNFTSNFGPRLLEVKIPLSEKSLKC